MARDENVSCPAGQWTELTNTDCSGNMTVSVVKNGVYVRARSAATVPPDNEGAALPEFGAGWNGRPLADLFPGVTSPVRLYGRPIGNQQAEVFVSHGA